MNVKNFLKFKAVVSLGFGIVSLFIPGIALPIYDLTMNAQGLMFARWFGAMSVGIGLICWFASSDDDSALRRSILLSLFICDTAGFIVSLIAQLQGLANALGWSTVATWGILAAGLGYFRFIKK